MKKGLFAIFALLLIFSLHGEEYPWKKYETGNFKLYFSGNLDRRVIPLMIAETEKAETFIRNLYNWTPSRKIVIVFDRELDSANGWARSYLKDKLYLYIYPPDQYSSLANYKNFVKNLLVHEYTHINQVGMVSGLPWVVNSIFGNWLSPGQMMPVWLIEGAAVYSESKIDGKGRLNFSLYKAYFYSFFKEGKVFKISQLNGTPEHWQGGSIPYLYGTFFYDYIAKKHGPEKMARFFHEMSDNIVPYMVEKEAENIFGEGFADLYDNFIEYYSDKFKKMDKYSDTKIASEMRFSHVYVPSGKSDKYLFAGSLSGERGIFSFGGTGVQKKLTAPSINSFSIDAKNLIIAKNSTYKDSMSFSDLFLFKLGTKSYRRLTVAESAYDPLLYNENSLIYFSYKGGVNRVLNIDLKSGNTVFEKELFAFDTIYAPSVSSDHKKIIFTGNLRENEKNIFIMNLDHKNILEIDLPGNQYSASFISDDQILFATDYDEKIVIMLLNLSENRLYFIHRPETIAIFPKIIDNKLYFISFDNNGYYPAIAEISKHFYRELSSGYISVVKNISAPPTSSKKKFELEDVSFFEGLMPSLLVPEISSTLSGISLSFSLYGEGNTSEKAYVLSASKNFDDTDIRSVNFNYSDITIWPGFSISLTYQDGKSFFINKYNKLARGEYLSLSSSISFNKRFENYFFLTESYIGKLNHTVGLRFAARALRKHVYNNFSDPLFFPVDDRDVNSLTNSISYRAGINFAPGSYKIFSAMESTSLNIPLSYTYDPYLKDSLVLNPTFYFSSLILNSEKVGFISKMNLFTSFPADKKISIGGYETDREIDFYSVLMYGYSKPLTVRGYPYGAAVGSTVFYSNNELRFHIATINRGVALLPLMIKNIQGDLFFDYGSASDNINFFDDRFILGTGAEIKLLTEWGYRIPILFRAGIARGVTESGITNIYFSFGNSF